MIRPTEHREVTDTPRTEEASNVGTGVGAPNLGTGSWPNKEPLPHTTQCRSTLAGLQPRLDSGLDAGPDQWGRRLVETMLAR
jgi:hypothetical protein